MNNSHLKKYLQLATIPLAVGILFIISLYRFNVPTRDEYAFVVTAQNLDSVRAAMQMAINGGGRILTYFLTYLFLMDGLDFTRYRILIFLCLVLFLVVAWLNINNFFRKNSLVERASIFILFIAVWLFSLRSIRDALFWLGGAVNYLIPLTIALFCVYLIYKFFRSEKRIVSYLLSALIIVIMFILPLGTEVLGMAALALCFMLLLITFANPKLKKLRYIFLLSVLALLAALLMSYLSPHTADRAASGYGGHFFSAVWVSLMTNFERTFETYVISMIIPASMVLYYMLLPKELPKLIPQLSMRLNIVAIYLIGFIATWAAQFTITFAMGYTGLPDRAKMIPQTIAVIVYITGNIYLLKSIGIENHIKSSAMFLLIIVALLYLMAFTSREFLGSLYSIGSFRNYSDAIEARHNYLESFRGTTGDVVVKGLDIAPFPTTDAHLTTNCNELANGCVTYYFDIKGCVKVDKEDGEEFRAKMYLMHLRSRFD